MKKLGKEKDVNKFGKKDKEVIKELRKEDDRRKLGKDDKENIKKQDRKTKVFQGIMKGMFKKHTQITDDCGMNYKKPRIAKS